MKVVILAGGLGTRLAEETVVKPKPMVEIGGMPIIWHIMKIYSAHGFNDFIICLGYKGYLIKEYFSNYFMHMSDITINLKDNTLEVHDTQAEPWKITLVETGTHSMTGGRIKRIKNYIGNKAFMLTYGDGVADIDINQLVAFHQQQQNCVTITSVQPSGRFGALHINDDDQVVSFTEKPRGDGNWINGGYFVCEPQIFDFIEGDLTSWEREPLEAIAKDGKMKAYKHNGFWKAMDTLRDKLDLEEAWEKNQAPWKIW